MRAVKGASGGETEKDMATRHNAWMVVAIITLFSTAQADIIPIGEFSGVFSEDFESFPIGGNLDTLVVAGGEGTFSSDPVGSNQLYIIEPAAGAGWNLGGYGEAGTIDEKSLGLFISTNDPVDVTLTLDTPAAALGFFFATSFDVADDGDMIVQFFDLGGSQLGVDQILDSGGSDYVWAGWSSATGIASVRFSHSLAPLLDNLQINPIPVPASFLLLAGLGATGCRRRPPRGGRF